MKAMLKDMCSALLKSVEKRVVCTLNTPGRRSFIIETTEEIAIGD